MIWTEKQLSTLHCYIDTIEFIPENKKEDKAASRMNSFFGDIIAEAMKKSEENRLKYYISIAPEAADSVININFSLRIRDRGRTIKSISYTSCWNKGVIVKNTGLDKIHKQQ